MGRWILPTLNKEMKGEEYYVLICASACICVYAHWIKMNSDVQHKHNTWLEEKELYSCYTERMSLADGWWWRWWSDETKCGKKSEAKECQDERAENDNFLKNKIWSLLQSWWNCFTLPNLAGKFERISWFRRSASSTSEFGENVISRWGFRGL